MPDSKCKEQSAKGDFSFFFNRFKEVLRALFSPAFAVLQLLKARAIALLQGKDIRRLFDPAIAVELFHLLGPQPLNVKGGAGHEMLELFDRLRGANKAAHTAAHGVALFAHRIRSAFRA